MSVLKTGWEERRVEVKSSFLSSNVEFSIHACNSDGRYTMQSFSIVQCDRNDNMYLETAGPWIHVPRYSWSLDTCS